MIAYVEGRLAAVTENSCVVVTEGGVGYEVYLTGPALGQLPAEGGSVRFFAATVVREDALELFGFPAWDDRQTFLLLTSITRVGARTAMAILSVFRPDDLRDIVIQEDILSLTRVPGIGKKTAQQVFLELKYKLKVDGPMLRGGSDSVVGSVLADAAAGLLNLGYSESEAVEAVKKALAQEPDLDVGGALRAALKILARAKG